MAWKGIPVNSDPPAKPQPPNPKSGLPPHASRYPPHWPKEGLVSWVLLRHNNPVTTNFFKNATQQPTKLLRQFVRQGGGRDWVPWRHYNPVTTNFVKNATQQPTKLRQYVRHGGGGKDWVPWRHNNPVREEEGETWRKRRRARYRVEAGRRGRRPRETWSARSLNGRSFQLFPRVPYRRISPPKQALAISSSLTGRGYRKTIGTTSSWSEHWNRIMDTELLQPSGNELFSSLILIFVILFNFCTVANDTGMLVASISVFAFLVILGTRSISLFFCIIMQWYNAIQHLLHFCIKWCQHVCCLLPACKRKHQYYYLSFCILLLTRFEPQSPTKGKSCIMLSRI